MFLKPTLFRLARIFMPALLLVPLAVPVSAQSFPAAEQDEIRAIVRDYLLENPEIITEALNLLEVRQKEMAEAARLDAVTNMQAQIFDSANQVVLGNPDGDVTMVEFFDYNCGFCKRAHMDMMALIEADPNLRFVLKEFPVLGEGSVEAARVSIAVSELAPEKFEEFHLQLLLGKGQANAAKAIKVAIGLGIDRADLEAATKTDRAAETIQEVYMLADALGLTGTPSYVVGKQILFGAVGADQLRDSVEKARDQKS
ncbi:MAG: DsbA family protein, partial [Hyphomicrobiales bacterium]